MKGPALQYDIRALRHFICDACGRTCDMPGRFTSCQCSCSSPPRWMRPIDRPAVTRPDVTAFISPADPLDHVVDENESDEVIPGWKPPVVVRTSQPPQRRRLSEDLPSESLTESEHGQQDSMLPAETDHPDHSLPQRQSLPANRRDRRPDRYSHDADRPRGQRGSESQQQQRRGSGPRPGPRHAPHATPQAAPDDFGSGLDAAAAPAEDHQSADVPANDLPVSDIINTNDERSSEQQPSSADRRGAPHNRRRPRRRGRGEGRSDGPGRPDTP